MHAQACVQTLRVHTHILKLIHMAKGNPYSSLQIKYKEEWEKTKSKACDIGVDDLSVKAARASRDLASDVSKHTLQSEGDRADG